MNEDLSQAISVDEAADMIMQQAEPENVEAEEETQEGTSEEVEADEVQAEETEEEDTSETEGETEDADAEDGEEAEDDEPEEEADPILRVKTVNGEQDVPQSEVIAGYMRQQDYTQKTMEVAEGRKAVQSLAVEVTEKEQQLKQALEYWATPKQTEPDWGALAQQGYTPAQIFQAQGEWKQGQAKQQEAMQMHQALQQQEQQKAEAASQESAKEEMRKLTMARPELADPVKLQEFGQQLAQGAQRHYGLPADALNAITDAQTLLILADALKYKGLDEGKAAVAKKVATAPKKLKPGAKPAAKASAKDARQKLMARVAKGDESAALELLMMGD